MLPPDYKPRERSFCKLEGTKLWFRFYREMVQRLRARSAFPDHQDCIPRAHMVAHICLYLQFHLTASPVLHRKHIQVAQRHTWKQNSQGDIINLFMEKTLRSEILLDGEK